MKYEDTMMYHLFKSVLNGLHLTFPSGLSYSKDRTGDKEFRLFKNFEGLLYE